ncbi:MAG: SRPBCC family protein [Oligoflexia bacterium]|nr:SRPBCC family protein [Oligoflexia bacterium]
MSNELLAARVRSRLRESLPHSEAVTVEAKDSTVLLSGMVLHEERGRIEELARRVAGVAQVENQLRAIDQPASVRESGRTTGRSSGWGAGARALAGLGATGLLASARSGSGWLRPVLQGAGASLALRALLNVEALGLITSVLKPEVQLKRTVLVAAPPEDVFDFWKDFSNFPRFMSYVRRVKVNERGGISWVLQSPHGIRFTWSAEITSLVPGRELSWRTVGGKLGETLVRNTGQVRFEALVGARTRVRVALGYSVSGGALGLGASRALGFDPRARIDGDLAIMKGLIERRKEQPSG